MSNRYNVLSTTGFKLLKSLDNFHDAILERVTIHQNVLILEIERPFAVNLQEYIDTRITLNLLGFKNTSGFILPETDMLIAGISIFDDNNPRVHLILSNGLEFEFFVNLEQSGFLVEESLSQLGIF